jgi:hypothetical protein
VNVVRWQEAFESSQAPRPPGVMASAPNLDAVGELLLAYLVARLFLIWPRGNAGFLTKHCRGTG